MKSEYELAKKECALWIFNVDVGRKHCPMTLRYTPKDGYTGGECKYKDGTCAFFTPRSARIRRCPDCGELLKPRQRYCGKCTIKRRKKTKRESKRGKTNLPVDS